MTLTQLALTVAVLGVLGLLASRFGLSAIPAYLLTGIQRGEEFCNVRPEDALPVIRVAGPASGWSSSRNDGSSSPDSSG